VALRGLQIHLTRWGPETSPDRPPVFLLHGFMDTSDTFQFLVDAFEADWPLIALDWRGFGRSEWPSDGYWFPDYVADLEALLNLFTPNAPARLVGHSMGGNVAGLYGGARPERVRCLVNLEGFGLPRMSIDQAPARMRQWLEQLASTPEMGSYDSFEQLGQVIRKRYPRVPPERALFIAKSWGGVDSDGRVRLRGDPRHKRVNPVLYRRDEAECFWRRLSAPVLMLFGDQSEFSRRLGDEGTAEAFQKLIPQVRTATIAGVGHMMHLERPEAIAPTIENFLLTS
jgi:pimeloyl-ACP methyl ester carboxylesterase